MAESALNQIADLVNDIFSSQHPADRVLDAHFRRQRPGPHLRQQITETLFFVVRHRRYLETVLSLEDPSLPATAEQLVRLALDRQNRCGDADSFTPAQRYSLPDWMWENLVRQWGLTQTEQLALSLNGQASVDVRVNLMRASRQQVMDGLADLGCSSRATPYAPTGVRLEKRQPLSGLDMFQKGWIEVQDEGSQLISHLLSPKPGQTVVDLCAGGGGKTLHLASIMRNQGRLIATDSDVNRLKRLKPRMKRAGVRMIKTLGLRHERDPKLKPFMNKADAVLVDAPCSGSGTFRRRPEIKWRITSEQIEALYGRQCSLLEAGSRLVRPGGCLVYATCSLFLKENQSVVEDFLANNGDFRLLHALDVLALQNIEGLPHHGPFLIMLPHQTATDGFFAALFQKPPC